MTHLFSYTFWLMKAVDFVDKLLRYDHQERPTAKEAMVSNNFSLISF